MKVFKERSEVGGSIKEAEAAAKEVLSLPVEPLMGNDEISHVIKQISNALRDQ